MKITQKTEVPLLRRTRIYGIVDHTEKPTPTKVSIKKSLASELNTKEELIAIRHVYTKYGQSKSKVIAHIYKNEKDLKELETKKVNKENVKKTETKK